MKTRVKRATIRFIVKDGEGVVHPVTVSEYLTKKQARDMSGKPDLILQFAHFLRDEHRRRGRIVRVEASSLVSLNGRPYRELIRPGTDLTKEKRRFLPYGWITRQINN